MLTLRNVSLYPDRFDASVYQLRIIKQRGRYVTIFFEIGPRTILDVVDLNSAC